MAERNDEQLDRLREKVRARRKGGLAEATLASYKSAWRDFRRWCKEHGEEPLPADPEAVSDYLVDRVERFKRESLKKHLAAIAHFHREAGHASPTDTDAVKDLWEALRLMELVHAEPVAVDIFERLDLEKERLIPPPGDDLRTLRDRALILLGIAGDLRRSQLARLDVEDLSFESKGLRLKFEDERDLLLLRAEERALCPARAIERWLEASGIEEGAVFRGITVGGRVRENRLRPESVSRIVKRAAKEAGLDPKEYSTKDLRSNG